MRNHLKMIISVSAMLILETSKMLRNLRRPKLGVIMNNHEVTYRGMDKKGS